jgi:putative Holliday junction resolvase
MMKTVGLDLGEKTLGIAISDALGMMAHGVETFVFTTAHYKHAVEHLVEFTKTNSVTKFVLGLPKNMDGTEGERAEISRRFAKKLTDATGLPVILWDERLTCMQAE